MGGKLHNVLDQGCQLFSPVDSFCIWLTLNSCSQLQLSRILYTEWVLKRVFHLIWFQVVY